MMMVLWLCIVLMLLVTLSLILVPYYQLAWQETMHQAGFDDVVMGAGHSHRGTELNSRLLVWTLTGFIGLGAPLLYWHLGSAQELAFSYAMREPITTEADARLLAEQLEAIVAKKQNNARGYYLLAQMYIAQENYDAAREPLRRVMELSGESAELLAQYAQAQFFVDNKQVTPVNDRLIDRALSLDPDNTMALGLKGIAAFGKADYHNAVKAWEKLKSVDGGGNQGSLLDAAIKQAKQAISDSQ